MKFNESTRKVLIAAVGLCAPRSTCALKAGIDVTTLTAWLRRGETDADGNPLDTQPGTAEYVEFRRAFLEAEAGAEESLVGHVLAIAQGYNCERKPDAQFKAASWLLERRHGKRWGYKATIEHEHSVEDLNNPDTRKPAIQELRAMGPEMVDLVTAAWCGSERDGVLTQAPGGLRQIWEAVGRRYGWTDP